MARSQRKTFDQLAAEQRRWIDEHGGNLAGYVARYGSGDDPVHYGDGGELIYEADMAALRRYERGAAPVRALRRAVDRAIAEGRPVYVNQPKGGGR